ncbi:hypothetical protein AHAS_Ahas11G0190000 [Arachis hypogaea]
MEFNSSCDQTNFMGIIHHHQLTILFVAGNITKKSQLLSTPINGDMLQNHKMSKRIIWDIAHHHNMIQIIILMMAGNITKK